MGPQKPQGGGGSERLPAATAKRRSTKKAKSVKQPGPIDRHIGMRIRAARMNRGLGQEALSKALGISFQMVQKYELAQSRVSVARLHDIARVTDVPMTYFLEGYEASTDKRMPAALEALQVPGAIELLEAFARQDRDMRDSLLKFVQSLPGKRK